MAWDVFRSTTGGNNKGKIGNRYYCTYQPCKGPPGDEQVHAKPLVIPEVPAQVLGEGLDCGLAGVVGRVAGRVGDALLAPCDHDCGRGVGAAGLERGDVGIEAVNHAEEVGGKDL